MGRRQGVPPGLHCMLEALLHARICCCAVLALAPDGCPAVAPQGLHGNQLPSRPPTFLALPSALCSNGTAPTVQGLAQLGAAAAQVQRKGRQPRAVEDILVGPRHARPHRHELHAV